MVLNIKQKKAIKLNLLHSEGRSRKSVTVWMLTCETVKAEMKEHRKELATSKVFLANSLHLNKYSSFNFDPDYISLDNVKANEEVN